MSWANYPARYCPCMRDGPGRVLRCSRGTGLAPSDRRARLAGAEAAEHAGVLEAGSAGGGLDGGAVAGQVPGSLRP